MTEGTFREVAVECPECGHDFPIMVHKKRGSTITICEGCLERLRVEVKNGEVTNVEIEE